uniref:ADP-ribosylhydrolase ARH3 n=1 Tax=Timema tahoe TaxID=61484 RepID=A0A7R9IGS5_9NEOP|nr:unnamed protein product [Timema tahoe]
MRTFTHDGTVRMVWTAAMVARVYLDLGMAAMLEFSSLDKYNFSVNMKEDIGSCNRFVKEYFGDKNRGYGQQIVEVFHKLRVRKFKDPYGPAKEQFEGTGSYGNGAAMRTAPIALFCHKNYEELLDTARKCAELTHTHKQGYNGAILQVDDPFRRTLQYAISLGGDTDTIASMAGAIAGAFYGYEAINTSLQKHCELLDQVIKYADDLFKLISA